MAHRTPLRGLGWKMAVPRSVQRMATAAAEDGEFDAVRHNTLSWISRHRLEADGYGAPKLAARAWPENSRSAKRSTNGAPRTASLIRSGMIPYLGYG